MTEYLIRILLKLLFVIYPKCYQTIVHNPPPEAYRRPYIYAHYHGDELVLVPSQKGHGITTLSSLSRDGQRMSALLKFLGYNIVVGSSSKRAVGGLIELKNYLQAHPGPASFAVDGPHGPRQVIKPGVIWLSQKLGIPIIFISVHCKHRWVFTQSWNQTFIPKPFSQAHIYCSDPYLPPSGLDTQQLAQDLTPWMQQFHDEPGSTPLFRSF